MKFRNMMFLLSLLLLMCGPAWAQEGEVSLDHVDGLYNTDTVNIDQVITFHIRMNNNTGGNITGSTNGFRVYSLSGAEWDTTTGATTGAITADMYDGGFFVNPYSDDGLLSDTVGFGGFKLFKPGLADGFNEIVATIDIGPIDAVYHKGQICLDSSFYVPAGLWLWSSSPDVNPAWDGPHCFVIFDPDAPITNDPPELAFIGPQATNEGVQLTFGISATDPDNGPPALSVGDSDIPGLGGRQASFIDNGDGTGTFDWTPTFDEAGTYTATFYADDGTDIDSEVVAFTVTNVTQPPVLGEIGAQGTAECQSLIINMSADDPEGGTPTFTMIDETLPAEANFTDNGNGTATFDWTPAQGEAGAYVARFVATVGALADSELVDITVTTNAAPTIDPIDDQSFGECGFLTFTVPADDPESGPLTFSSPALPGTSTLDPNTGVFEWTSQAGDAAGSPYAVQILVDDNCGNQSNTTVNITVGPNNAPAIDPIADPTVTECDVVSFTVTADDIDGGTPVLSSGALPGTATFDPGTGAFEWTTEAGDAAGSPYTVDFTATDACGGTDNATVTITIDANNAPAIDPIADPTVTECDVVSFTVTADDPDGGTPVLSSGALPGTATFDTETGAFSWTTEAGDAAGSPYSVDFTATDPCGVTDNVTVTITIDPNQAPTIAQIDDFNAPECVPINLGVSASDPDLDNIILTTSTLPGTAEFNDNGDGTGTFTWTPAAGDAGAYPIDFIATDDCGLATTEPVTITIDANQEPTITGAATFTAKECEASSDNYSATDPELLGLTFSLLTPPAWATLTDNGDGTASIDFAPVFGDAGLTTVSLAVTDACGGADTLAIDVTVDPDGAPTVTPDLASYPDLMECVEDTITFTYSDPEATTMTFEVIGIPPDEVTIVDNGDGTGYFFATPPSDGAGTDTIQIVGTDECGSADTVDVELVIAEDEPPVFATVDPVEYQQGDTVTIVVTATDPEAGPLTLRFDTTDLPDDGSTFTFTDSGNGVASLEWYTHLLTGEASYEISFYASDGCDETEVIVTVGIITGVALAEDAELPDEFYLTQNFPNPFNPFTQIKFGIPEKSHVTLAVYNVLGQRIRTLVNESLAPNNYLAEWDGNSDAGVRVASGIYFYKLETSLYTDTKKMILLK